MSEYPKWDDPVLVRFRKQYERKWDSREMRLWEFNGVMRPHPTIDIPCEVIEDKQLPAHEPQEPKP